MQRFGLQLDRNFTLAFKTLMQADEIIRTLDPYIGLSATMVESSVPLLREQFNPEALGKTLQTQVSRSLREVDTSDLTPQVEKLDRALTRSLDRLLVGLVLSGWLVGAAIASTVNVQVGNFQLSDLAFYMFMAGAVVGAVVAIQGIIRLNRETEEE